MCEMSGAREEIEESEVQRGADETVRLPSPRAAYGVVLLAIVLAVAMAGFLEVFHRVEITRLEWLGRVPPDWSDPQLRDFATAAASVGHILLDEQTPLMKAVAGQRSTGDVTAAAAHWLFLFWLTKGVTPGEKAAYGQLATEAVPADSPKLKLYYLTYARSLSEEGKIEEAAAALRRGIMHAADPNEQASLLSILLRTLEEHIGPEEALDTYQDFADKRPALVKHDAVREMLAGLLCTVGQESEARDIYTDLAENGGTSERRERAAQKLTELESGAPHGH